MWPLKRRIDPAALVPRPSGTSYDHSYNWGYYVYGQLEALFSAHLVRSVSYAPCNSQNLLSNIMHLFKIKGPWAVANHYCGRTYEGERCIHPKLQGHWRGYS